MNKIDMNILGFCIESWSWTTFWESVVGFEQPVGNCELELLERFLPSPPCNSVKDSLDVYVRLFSDSDIVSMVKLDRQKLRNLTNFGIAP